VVRGEDALLFLIDWIDDTVRDVVITIGNARSWHGHACRHGRGDADHGVLKVIVSMVDAAWWCSGLDSTRINNVWCVRTLLYVLCQRVLAEISLARTYSNTALLEL
jgi:hypothetical protein